ncbi:MAG: hypothetical protein VX438_05330, partial [Planctomycetota bacterium]|nr:hypothetical protein [Planctomycetota bacterium]
MELLQSIKSRTAKIWSDHQTKKKSAQIYWALRNETNEFRAANFRKINESNLAIIFELYDSHFFDNEISRLLGALNHPLSFRLSGKMTRAGGTTTREETWQGRKLLDRKYEIAISATLMFQTFKNDHKPVNVTGIECTDRLQALQRIMEHEIIHLVEMIVWYHSDCFRKRFKSITGRLFGHTESTHELTTVDESAFAEFGVQVGQRVNFVHGGKKYGGFVNRITKRATVLVETPRGELFTDGKRYA